MYAEYKFDCTKKQFLKLMKHLYKNHRGKWNSSDDVSLLFFRKKSTWHVVTEHDKTEGFYMDIVEYPKGIIVICKSDPIYKSSPPNFQF